MALTYSIAPAPPDAINLGEPEGTKPITTGFNGNIQSSKLVYIGGKVRVAALPKATVQVRGLLVGITQDYKSEAQRWSPMPKIALLRNLTDFENQTLTIGDKKYANAIRTGGAIQTQDVGEGFKLLNLTNIYTIFGRYESS
jgi:hypothetical protein